MTDKDKIKAWKAKVSLIQGYGYKAKTQRLKTPTTNAQCAKWTATDKTLVVLCNMVDSCKNIGVPKFGHRPAVLKASNGNAMTQESCDCPGEPNSKYSKKLIQRAKMQNYVFRFLEQSKKAISEIEKGNKSISDFLKPAKPDLSKTTKPKNRLLDNLRK